MAEKVSKFGKLIFDIQVFLKEIRNGHNLEELLGIGRILSLSLLDFMEGNNLIGYWIEITGSYHQNPKSVNDCINLMMRCYRYAGNLSDVLGESLPEVFNQTQFFRTIIDSLLKAFNQIPSSSRNDLGCIVRNMTTDAIRAIGWTLCDPQYSHSYLLSFIQILHFPTLLQLLLSLHRIPLISKSLNPEIVNSIYTLVGLLLQRLSDLSLSPPQPTVPQSLQCLMTTESRIQSYLPLLIQKSSTPRMARTIALTILESDVPCACFQVASLWSERVFVNQGNFEMQAYTTAFILTSLQRMNRDDLLIPLNQLTAIDDDASFKHTLMSILSRGVSVQLDSPTTLTRINGMRVAEKLSEVMTSAGDVVDADRSGIHFEELKKYCEDPEGYMTPIGSRIEAMVTPEKDHKNEEGRRLERVGETIGESDSDSDDEFQSYFMREKLDLVSTQDEDERKQLIEAKISEIEAKDESIKVLKYLRDCLSSLFFPRPSPLLQLSSPPPPSPLPISELQFTDSSNPDGLYANHRASLVSIPIIVQRKPADGRDLAAPLIKELLRLSNSFNMEKFNDLRNAAADSLLFAYPKEVTSIISWAVSSDTMTLGSRLEVITLMVRGAYHLSGMLNERKPPSSALPQPTSMNQQRALRQHPQEETRKIFSHNGSTNAVTQSKTIVKRPLRLASLKQKTRYFRNHFPLCAESFFTIVFKSLNDSVNELHLLIEKRDSDPGVHILFPAQALLALGAFTRCAINTPLQRKFAMLLLPFAFQLCDVPSLHIRRATMVAMFDAVESLLVCFETNRQSRPQLMAQQEQLFGTLDYALNITREEPSSGPSLPPILIEIMNWISQRVHEEADQDCKVFQFEILRVALAFLESFQS